MPTMTSKAFTVVLGFCLCLLTVTPTASKWIKPLKTRGGEDPDPEVNAKREFVKQMFKDAWDDYVRHAWGENELKPVSQSWQSGTFFGGAKIGTTIIDSLDTMYIMGLDNEFQRGRDWIEENLNFDNVNATVSVFQTNIRIIGGFLAAYALTGDQMFVDKAYDIATRLLPAFDSPTGIPYGYLDLQTGEPVKGSPSVLAEIGTWHLEFLYLSHLTGDPIFREKVVKIRQVLKDVEKPGGLYWNYMSPETGEFTHSNVSLGVRGDSFYEYLLKAWIQTGDREARDLYDDAMTAFVTNDLVRVSSPSNLLYIAEQIDGEIVPIVGHLACFAGGMFVLGSMTDPNEPGNRERDFEIGQNFTNTCHESYMRTATKMGPEFFYFTNDTEAEGLTGIDLRYILRPEVIESYFVLYRLTGDPKYRDWGWEVVQAIEKHCKAGPGRGYSGIVDVYAENPEQDDVQQTYFLAETLKYLYLLFSTNDFMDLNTWVFNTEAHPLPHF